MSIKNWKQLLGITIVSSLLLSFVGVQHALARELSFKEMVEVAQKHVVYDPTSGKYTLMMEDIKEDLDELEAEYYLKMGGYVQWQTADNDKLKVRFKVTNESETRTVKAFELYVYATDVWDEPLYGDDIVYYETTEKNVEPGETVYSNYIVIPQRKKISKIYGAVHRVLYSDGRIDEIWGPDLEYMEFDYTK